MQAASCSAQRRRRRTPPEAAAGHRSRRWAGRRPRPVLTWTHGADDGSSRLPAPAGSAQRARAGGSRGGAGRPDRRRADPGGQRAGRRRARTVESGPAHHRRAACGAGRRRDRHGDRGWCAAARGVPRAAATLGLPGRRRLPGCAFRRGRRAPLGGGRDPDGAVDRGRLGRQTGRRRPRRRPARPDRSAAQHGHGVAGDGCHRPARARRLPDRPRLGLDGGHLRPLPARTTARRPHGSLRHGRSTRRGQRQPGAARRGRMPVGRRAGRGARHRCGPRARSGVRARDGRSPLLPPGPGLLAHARDHGGGERPRPRGARGPVHHRVRRAGGGQGRGSGRSRCAGMGAPQADGRPRCGG